MGRLHSLLRFLERIRQSLTVPLKLDVHAVEHCNLNCKSCCHYSSIAQPEFLDPEVLEKNLMKLSKFQSSFHAFQILGGEPLLHPDLADIMDISRKYFDKIRITLTTNGILLLNDDKLPHAFWQSCKKNNIVIRLTRYPVKIDYQAIEKKTEEKGIELELYYDRAAETRWGLYRLQEKDIRSRLNRIKCFRYRYCNMKNNLQLSGDKIYPCPMSAYVRHLNKFFNRNFKIGKKDYVCVDNLRHILQLRRLIFFSVPFCQYCGSGRLVTKWGISGKDIHEWVDTSKDDKL